MKRILETERLLLREMTQADYPALTKILQDPKTMYAYEGAFNSTETQEWLNNNLRRYCEDGFGLWAVVLKDTDEMIGQCGVTWQSFNGEQVPEIGYLFNRSYWHRGFAAEAAIACKHYAFDVLNFNEIYSIIRDTNQPSINVAIRNGMTPCGQFVKHYRGVTMPHTVFSVKKV